MKKLFVLLALIVGATATASAATPLTEVMVDSVLPMVVIAIVSSVPVLITIFYMRYRHQAKIAKYRVVEKSIEAGYEIPKGLFDEDDNNKSYLKKGCIKVGVGIGLGVMLWFLTHQLGVACVGILVFAVGVAELVIAYFNGEMKRTETPATDEEQAE